jgi:hypothetical protein
MHDHQPKGGRMSIVWIVIVVLAIIGLYALLRRRV